VLKCAANEDVLTLRAEDKPNELSLSFEDTKQDRISQFSLKLMDIDQAYLSIPETEYTASITMPSSELQRICRDFNTLSDSVTVEATKDGILFSAEGDVGSGSVHLKPYSDLENKDKSVTINVSEPASLKFNLKYFNNITRAASLSSTVQIQMCNDLPAEIEFKLPNGYVRYYFAPKYE
jgi:proliferating cell nuclear antigen